jgi:3',5'-cyclic AMP phosphodiesterase CpdA
MQTYRIAHISDLHLSAEHHRKHVRHTKKIIDCALRNGADHIVITGDISANAGKRDLELARQLFRSLGLLDASRLSLVIGNHDVFGGVHIAEDVLDFPKRCKRVDYDDKVEQFHHTFREVFEKCLTGRSHRLFPFAKVVGDIMLVGINSVARYSRLGNPVGSNGEVEESEFASLENMLASRLFRDRRKVVMIHHHFSRLDVRKDGTMHSVWAAIEKQTIKLRGKKRLLKLFKEHNIEIVLHGHVHENHEYVRDGIRFLNGGGSVLGVTPGQLSYNMLSISDNGITTQTLFVQADTKERTIRDRTMDEATAQAA